MRRGGLAGAADHLSSPRPAAVMRGNTMMYLFIVDILTFIAFGLKGLLVFLLPVYLQVLIGVLLSVSPMIAALAGQRICDLGKDYLCRRVTYVLIGISAVAGLPVWD